MTVLAYPRADVQVPLLSPYERKLLHLACQDLMISEIAELLHFTPQIIGQHIRAIEHSLGVSNRNELFLRARALGLISTEIPDWLTIIEPATISEALTPRERDVIRLVAQGLTTDELQERLNVKHPTIEMHMRHIRVKLGARTRVQAVLKAISAGLV